MTRTFSVFCDHGFCACKELIFHFDLAKFMVHTTELSSHIQIWNVVGFYVNYYIKAYETLCDYSQFGKT